MAKSRKHKRAKVYEKRKAREHGGKPLGGPGRSDYVRGKVKGEVKNWKVPVHSGVIKDAKKKGVGEIDSKSGFTEPAKELAKKVGMKLISRGKEVR